MPEYNTNRFILKTDQMTPIVETVPGSSGYSAAVSAESSQVTMDVSPGIPSFSVPSNPLLPPGYQETLDYNSLQYANGFYRTQIGRYVRIEQLLGSNSMVTQEGFLIGVGYNYIILQEVYTSNILVVDIYTIKNMYVFYNDSVVPTFDTHERDSENDI